MVSIRLKHVILGTFLEPVARCYVHRVQPLFDTVRHPERALLYQETHFLLKAMRKLIDETSNCVDVGSHIGLVLNEFMRLAPRGSHIGVEPTPQKASWLRRKFPGANIFECALADAAGTAVFHENMRSSALNALGSLADRNRRCDDRIVEYKVEVKTLDDIVEPSQKIRLIKIDAEGAELLILKGGKKLIARDRPALIFECGADFEGEHVNDGDDTYTYLTEKAGYTVHTPVGFLCKNKPLSREVFNHARSFPATSYNFIALPR